jgi:long-chain-alcohol oxidase
MTSCSATNNCLTRRQEAVLSSYVDALLPPIVIGPPTQRESDSDCIFANDDATAKDSETESVIDSSVQRYWEYRLSNDPLYMDALAKTIRCKLSLFDRFSTLMLLNVLDTTIGTCLIFNMFHHQRRFADYTLQDRSQILLPSLQYSKNVVLRKVFQSLRKLLCGMAFTYHCQNMEYINPFWKAMGYPGSPASWLSPKSDDLLLKKAMAQQMPIIEALKRSKRQVTQCTQHLLELECDVVIIGSGSGGSVAAQVLSAAGYDVIVLEKGSYQSPSDISLNEIHAMDQQYEHSGLLQNTTGTVMILAGSTLGGGPAINWACCLPLPQYVRDEWINEHKLHDSMGPEYDASLKIVLDTLGLNAGDCIKKPSLTHNAMNRKLQEGCDSLGYEWKETGQVSSSCNGCTP